MTKYRTLCHEREYTEAVDALVAENPRYREVIDGIEWGVCQRPEEYPQIPSLPGATAHVYMAPGAPFTEIAHLRVFFLLDNDDQARMLAVEKVDPSELADELG